MIFVILSILSMKNEFLEWFLLQDEYSRKCKVSKSKIWLCTRFFSLFSNWIELVKTKVSFVRK